jgi:hypothetical protein
VNRISLFLVGAAICIPLAAEVKLTQQPDRIDIEIGGKPFSTFYIAGDAPKPYLHPLRAASGTVVTRKYPMEQVEGETRDHKHHRGLWFTHGDVNGFDFWMNEPDYKSDKKGLIKLEKVHKVKGGKTGVIEASFIWADPAGKPLLKEHRTMTFYDDSQTTRTFDVDIRLDAIEKVTFGDTKEGTFAIRLADVMNEKKTGTMTNAEGAQKMKSVWGKASPWVDYVGKIGDETVGIAILDHPGNPKHPTFWHSRDYGLFAANPFGEHDFFNDKTRNGSMTLEPGKSLRWRYRVVIHPEGTPIADQFKKFAAVR